MTSHELRTACAACSSSALRSRRIQQDAGALPPTKAPKGWLAINSVTLLEPLEKPCWRPAKVGILEGEDLARVLDNATRYREVFELLGVHRSAHRRGPGAVLGRRGP